RHPLSSCGTRPQARARWAREAADGLNARKPRADPGLSQSVQTLRLLEGDRRAGLFEGSLGLLGGLLVGALQDSLGSTVDDGLGLAETQRGELADRLDD